MRKLGFVACAAFALTATSASANGYWQNGSYYTYPTTTSQSTTTYSAPSTTVVGTVGPIQSAGTTTYVQPSTYGTTYTAPVTTYSPPSYAVVPSSTNTYVAPTTTYIPPPTTIYTRPATTTYAPAPTYTVPAYAPIRQYDGTRQVRDRIRNQRNRIERALDRGDLRRGEERRLRERLREIRQTFRAYRDNDGFIGRHEEAALMRMLNDNSRRIFRLANNNRVAGNGGGYRVPYAY